MGYLQRDHGGAWWFRYSGKEEIRGKFMPWGTVWSWSSVQRRMWKVMGKDGLSLVIFQALRHNTGVGLSGCPVLGISLWNIWVFWVLGYFPWVGELRGRTPLPLVYIHVSLSYHRQITVKRQEVKREKGVTSAPHGAHMDTAVLWHEGYPITLGCYSHLRSCLDWEGMPQVTVLLLISSVLQEQVISQGHHLWHHKPLSKIHLFQPYQSKPWQMDSHSLALTCVLICEASPALIIHEAIIWIPHRHWATDFLKRLFIFSQKIVKGFQMD